MDLSVGLRYISWGMECDGCFDWIGEEIFHDWFDAMQCSEEATEKDDHPDEPTNAALRAPGMIQSSNTLVNNKLWERRTILFRKIVR